MKSSYLYLFIFIASVLPIRADEELKNPDFSDGISHWEGGVESGLNDDGFSEPSDPGSPSLKAGIFLKLSAGKWSPVSQQFRPLATSGILTIVYKFSDGLTFSSRPNAYRNVPGRLGYTGDRSPNPEIGHWIAFLAEGGNPLLNLFEITPKMDNSLQTIHIQIKDMAAREDTFLVLAFPPGDGKVILYRVSYDGNP